MPDPTLADHETRIARLEQAAGLPPLTPVPTTTPAPAAPRARYPAELLGGSWYLTLPTGKQGDPDTVRQPQLAKYMSKYFDLTPAGDGAVFRAWHGGVTTSGSPNPRSELRECTAGGSSLAKWSAAKGTHTLTVEGQVNRLTKVRPHVVLWQVHGDDDDVCVFRLEGSKLWITNGDDNHGHLVTDQLLLGQRYELKGQFANGTARFWFNGSSVDYQVRSSDSGCYFKAGCYLQSNPKSAPGESTSEYAEVVVYRAVVTHAS